MKRTQIQQYERLTTLTLNQGFDLFNSGHHRVQIGGQDVTVASFRIASFFRNGVKCAIPTCSHQGQFFAVERDLHNTAGKICFHLNLWGYAEDGHEVLMTVDHIKARGRGGAHALANTQTMCCWHNWRKGKSEDPTWKTKSQASMAMSA